MIFKCLYTVSLFKSPYFKVSIRSITSNNTTNNSFSGNMKESTLILANGLLNG
jgi:hypothetical protein